MTYQEKYNELYKRYEQATEMLQEATKSIAFTNGFEDAGALGEYYNAIKAHRIAERTFNDLLSYSTSKSLNPDSEYVAEQFMYEHIKEDQRRRGTTWGEDEIRPHSGDGGVRGYECVIGLTNDGTIEKNKQETQYKFPVVSLEHGKQCYSYLVDMLQGDENFNVEALNFDDIVDPNQQIYIKVFLSIWEY